MFPLQSAVVGQQFKLQALEEKLKPLGYTIGGNWDYDHGYFDYKIDEKNGYTFLRLPFKAVDGELDQRGVTVRLGQPLLLDHQYQDNLDDNPDVFNGLVSMTWNSSFNQFQEPKDKDAKVDPKFLTIANSLIQELELTLIY
ncbi:YugN-like family protein [Halalkalibacter urbisdiaboli]|uniref:YugN-like family protein n=1 Tax=Halalkalibacter urbisdiaboli TaxID=1960589 RepID=UPI000B42FD0E|nr:YugN-like family protein [Halalkalibacter urbisdiaboli]